MTHQFEKAADAFGPLADEAREQLLREIDNINFFALRDVNFLPRTPTQNAKHFRTIASAAAKLRLLLDAECKTSSVDEFIDLDVSLNPVVFAYESAVQTRRIVRGFDQSVQIVPLQRLVVALTDLSSAAAEAASFQEKLKRKTRGGNIKGGTTSIKTILMRYSFWLYDETRKEYVDSGNQIANGPPLVRFVSAVLDGAGFAQKSNIRTKAHNHDVVISAFKTWNKEGRPPPPLVVRYGRRIRS